MNKAFTANINDQVTARGYLDENDQLIMLEPEGSGGGGCELSLIVPEQDITISTSGRAYLANTSAEGLSANDNVMLRVYNSNEGAFYLKGVIDSDPNDGTLYAIFEEFTIGAYQITVRIVFNNGLITFRNQYSDAVQGTYTVSVIK